MWPFFYAVIGGVNPSPSCVWGHPILSTEAAPCPGGCCGGCHPFPHRTAKPSTSPPASAPVSMVTGPLVDEEMIPD